MYDLKNFLEQNGQIVPQELQHAQVGESVKNIFCLKIGKIGFLMRIYVDDY